MSLWPVEAFVGYPSIELAPILYLELASVAAIVSNSTVPVEERVAIVAEVVAGDVGSVWRIVVVAFVVDETRGNSNTAVALVRADGGSVWRNIADSAGHQPDWSRNTVLAVAYFRSVCCTDQPIATADAVVVVVVGVWRWLLRLLVVEESTDFVAVAR